MEIKSFRKKRRGRPSFTNSLINECLRLVAIYTHTLLGVENYAPAAAFSFVNIAKNRWHDFIIVYSM